MGELPEVDNQIHNPCHWTPGTVPEFKSLRFLIHRFIFLSTSVRFSSGTRPRTRLPSPAPFSSGFCDRHAEGRSSHPRSNGPLVERRRSVRAH
jgi:hypothetical protein